MGFDAVVVGGGPVGCFFAGNLARRGWRVAIFEEHWKIGYPWCCAGVVGIGGMNELGLPLKKSLILEELRGAILHSPSGRKVEITRGRPEAWVVDRPAFDQSLADMAVRGGAELHLGQRCRRVEKGKVELGDRTVEGRVIVGADGPSSLVARDSGLEAKRSFMRFAQVEVEAEVTPQFAELYLGRGIAPGFFGWLVPAGERARVGVGTPQNPLPFLANLLKKLEKRIRGKISKPSVDLIKTSRSRPAGQGVILIGDAAGQVKPLTKGGLYIGLSCAKLAAEATSNYLQGKGALEAYARAVEEKFGEEFRWGDLAFSIYSGLGDRALDWLIRMVEKKRVQKFLAEEADFDHHSRILKKLPLLILYR
jgi:digeranylgeranylglycerophospholipid reductase